MIPIDLMVQCPRCHSPEVEFAQDSAKCSQCELEMPIEEGVPVLVADRELINSHIEEARALGKGAWYEESQFDVWTGPYRHHLKKRRDYLDRLFEQERQSRDSGFEGLKALDMGCGDGGNLKWLSGYFKDLYCSDYNLVRLLRAQKIAKGSAHLFMGDATNYPVRDGSFDYVFFNHVLEHIPDDLQALKEAHRILKPGGKVILGVPNEGVATWRLAYALKPSIRRATDHLHFYTPKSIADKCRTAGFSVDEVHPIGWGFPHWTIDSKLRSHKWIDDLFETIGKAVVPSQASSLYLVLSK